MHVAAKAELLSQLPLYSGLEGKLGLSAAEELRLGTCKAGEVLVRQGEYSEGFYVLLEGHVAVERVRLTGGTHRFPSLGAREWFGEMPALANQPHPVTIRAETDCRYVVHDGSLFRRLLDGDAVFRSQVDERYRHWSLPYHLRTVPLFRGVSSDTLRRISAEARVETLTPGAVIAREGDVARSVYLVRRGVVKRLESADAGESVVAYHCDNSAFGARCLTTDPVWPQTFVAVNRVDLVVIDADVLAHVGETAQRDRDLMQAAANDLLQIADTALEARLHSTRESRIARIDLMVDKWGGREDEALVIDLGKCIRCNACLVSCAEVHADHIPRFSKRGVRFARLALANACYYCHVPECMLGCSYGAIRRGLGGPVKFIDQNCTGCGVCAIKCPHDIIRMTAAAEPRPVKCDRCAGLPFEACLYNCPCGAIGKVSPDALVR